MEITNINQLDVTNGLYTYADYLLWKFEERLELIKGKIFKMSPAPLPTKEYHASYRGSYTTSSKERLVNSSQLLLM